MLQKLQRKLAILLAKFMQFRPIQVFGNKGLRIHVRKVRIEVLDKVFVELNDVPLVKFNKMCDITY